ncbi:MAG: HAD family phosphatase [Lentisphaeria bacterium]|nr:HAD family phosphatase [Lentisphaeria bacterium]NQZ66692.1 HAD family phosphatase [Lentisphaeria bacterium]
MNLDKYKAIIFDLDGLLLDTEKQAYESWMEAAISLNLKLSPETVLACVGQDDEKTHRIISLEIPQDQLMGLIAKRMELNFHMMETYGIPLKKGALELLQFLAEQNKDLAVVTSTPRERTVYKFSHSELKMEQFKVIVTRDEVSESKPKPEPYLMALEKLGIAAGEALAFEDSVYGAQSVHAAGIDLIIVPDLIEHEEETRKLAKATVDSLAEFQALL